MTISRDGARAAVCTGLLCAAAGCGNGVPETPTWSAHVAPILRTNCAGCHRSGGPAPFSVHAYEQVRARASLIAEYTRTRRMPPWLPGPGDWAFAEERRLSERDIEILARWAAQGAPRGDSTTMPEPVTDEWALGTPDLVLEMPEPYVVPDSGGDIFRNFVVPVPLTETRYVSAVELQAGNAKVVHHVVMAVDTMGISRQEDARDAEPGYDGMLSRGGARPPPGFFVGWTPGRVPRPNPEALAWAVTPGTDLVIQMHLRPHGHATPVRARVGLHFANEPPSRTPVLLRLGAQTLDIPPGVADYTVTDSLRLPVGVTLLGLYPHAHYLGKTMDVRVEMPDGNVRQLLRIDDWDFNWQDAYTFARPVQLPAGTTIRLRYSYDNSEANPRNPNRPARRVVYGPASTDEMAELWIQALPQKPEELAQLQQELRRKAVHDYEQGWQHLVRIDPRDASAHANLAALNAARGDTATAIDHYERAIAARPDFASAHYNLGLLYEAQQQPGQALEHYRRALELRPDHAGTHNNLGNVLSMLGRRAEAVAHFRRAVELEPRSAEAHNNLGRTLFDAGRVREALEHYAQAVELRPGAAPVRFNLALALAAAGRHDEAMRELEQGVRLQPPGLEARLAMAWLLATHADAGVRRPALALQLAQGVAEMAGQAHPRILDVLAAAWAAADSFQIAVPLAREALMLAEQRESPLAANIRARLRLYEQKRPWIDPS